MYVCSLLVLLLCCSYVCMYVVCCLLLCCSYVCSLLVLFIVVVVVFSLADDVDLQVATYTEFGKNFPKQMKMSPDGFVQNAILLTYFK